METEKYVYIFEFKCDKSADDALKQIEEKGYDQPYLADARSILKIGVNFDSNKKNITDWNWTSNRKFKNSCMIDDFMSGKESNID